MTTTRIVYDPESLAQELGCSKRTIYNLIKLGQKGKSEGLRAFTLGRGKRARLRVAAEEVERWRREQEKERNGTATETAPLDGEEAGPLPTTAMRALASVKG